MKKNVDIVLIPHQDIIDLVLKHNAAGVASGNATIELGKKDRIPHLSLLMGVLDEEHLDGVIDKLEGIAHLTSPVPLHITKEKHSSLVPDKTHEIMSLHERIVADIDPLLTHAGITDYYDEPAGYQFAAPERILSFVNNFITQYSHDKFWPHITIHAGLSEPVDFPIHTTATTLALYHLGDYDTCRSLLHSIDLNT